MPPDRKSTAAWRRVDAALQAALEQPPEHRIPWVEAHHADDPELKEELLSLLESEASSEKLFAAAREARDAIAAAAAEEQESDRVNLAGSRLGAYRLERLLATGGMGAVYRAQRDDGEFEQTVAIKILPGWATDEQTVARLRAERQILSALQHPNITRLLDGGQTADGYPYLVTEFIDGTTITDHAREFQLDLEARLQLFLDVVDAVQHAHEQGVVHRDIKPANILVDRQGRPHLLDFGIAKIRAGVLDPVTGLRTVTGFTPMTPDYASPEQLTGGEVGIPSDVYQLGLLLYRLVTGARLPVSASGGVTRPSTAVRRDEAGTPRMEGLEPATLSRALRGDVDTIILKALRPEPDQRYRSARALGRDLRHHLAGEAIEARPESIGSAARRLARHYPFAAGLSVALVVVLLVWAASLTFYARELENQRDEAERQAVRASQARDVLIDVFRRSDPLQDDAVGGSDASVWASLNAAANEARETLADDPAVLAELLGTLAVLQGYAGKPDRMMALLEESTSLYESLGPGHRPQAVMQKAELAKQLTVSDLERSQRLRDEVVLELSPLSTEDPLAAATALVDIGVIDYELGAYDEALGDFDEVLRLLDSEGAEEWSLRIEAHFGRGNVLTALDRLDDAAEALRRSLSLAKTHFGEEHDRMTGTLSALSILERRLGNEADAILWAEQLVEIMSRKRAPEYAGLLAARNNLALAYGRSGRFSEEQAILRDLVRIRRETVGPDGDRNLAVNLKNLATSMHRTGELESARQVVLEARTLMERHYPAESPIQATPWFTLGLIELDDGDATAAEESFRETLRILEPSLGEAHVQTHITRCFLAASLQRQGNSGDAAALAVPALKGIEAAPSSNPYYAGRCRETLRMLEMEGATVSGGS